jgi:carbon-monoxide dehydrogenase medium subunit
MSPLPAFAYYRPRTIQEACALLAAPGAAVLAGGTDLLVHMQSGRRVPTALVSLQELTDLAVVGHDDGVTVIGAGAPLSVLTDDAALADRYPVLAHAARFMGSLAIRAQGTVGGNLCNASPAADLPPVLMALDAEVVIAGAHGERELPLEEFFVGPGRTVLQPGELCTAVRIADRPAGWRTTYERLDQRRAMDIAVVSVAAACRFDADRITEARVVCGAVAPVPLRVPAAGVALVGTTGDAAARDAAAEAVEQAVSPITDVRATAAYRRDMTGALLRRAVERLGAEGAAHV